MTDSDIALVREIDRDLSRVAVRLALADSASDPLDRASALRSLRRAARAAATRVGGPDALDRLAVALAAYGDAGGPPTSRPLADLLRTAAEYARVAGDDGPLADAALAYYRSSC